MALTILLGDMTKQLHMLHEFLSLSDSIKSPLRRAEAIVSWVCIHESVFSGPILPWLLHKRFFEALLMLNNYHTFYAHASELLSIIRDNMDDVDNSLCYSEIEDLMKDAVQPCLATIKVSFF